MTTLTIGTAQRSLFFTAAFYWRVCHGDAQGCRNLLVSKGAAFPGKGSRGRRTGPDRFSALLASKRVDVFVVDTESLRQELTPSEILIRDLPKFWFLPEGHHVSGRG